MYIEDFIFQQVITCFCIIRLVTITTKHPTKWYRVLIAVAISSLISVILALTSPNSIVYSIILLVSNYLVVRISFFISRKSRLVSFFLYCLFSLSIKGLILSLNSTIIYSSIGIITYSKHSPLLILSTIIVFTYIYEWILNSIKIRVKSNSLIHKINLYVGEDRITLNGYVDTGNLANINGRGIIIIDYSTFLSILNKTKSNLTPTSTLKIGTATSTNSIPVFTLDKVEIIINNETKTYLNASMGVTSTPIFRSKNYRALISPEMI